MTKTINSLRILIVDDDDTQRMLMIDHLNRLGVTECLEVADGKQALLTLHLSSQNVDVIFTDNQMPVMDGPELIRTIRSLRVYSHIKMVMVSGNLSDRPNKQPAETILRDFLKEHDVLPIPKDRLSRDVLRGILEELIVD